MKIVTNIKTENCHFYSCEKSLYVACACFRNGPPMAAVESNPLSVCGNSMRSNSTTFIIITSLFYFIVTKRIIVCFLFCEHLQLISTACL